MKPHKLQGAVEALTKEHGAQCAVLLMFTGCTYEAFFFGTATDKEKLPKTLRDIATQIENQLPSVQN